MNFNDVSQELTKLLGNSKHILTFGFIGSLRLENDLDIIITKKKSSSTASFYKEIHAIFDKLERKLKLRVINFPLLYEESMFLAKRKKTELAFHTMVYTSWNQIIKDWSWVKDPGDTTIKQIIKEHYTCIKGSQKDLFSTKFAQKTPIDASYIKLYQSDRCRSYYPKSLLLQVTNNNLSDLCKKKLGMKFTPTKTQASIRQTFYTVCKKIDKKASM